MFKKLLLSLLTALVLFSAVSPNFLVAKAQSSTTSTTNAWYNSSFQDWYGKVYSSSNPSEIFGERYTAAQVQWVMYGLWAFIINSVTGPQNSQVISCILAPGANASSCIKSITGVTGSTTPSQDTAVAPSQNLWKLVFATNRPLSGIGYVKEKIDNFSLIPVAHAQTVGFGFNALQPIQPMWTVVRDFSYGLFVIVAVVFAFMIMFRVKLSPQTVISVQSALPKIIISLILVTFSYAIAGFLIDFMYIVIGIVSVMGSQFIHIPASNVFNFLTLGQMVGWNIQLGVFGALVIYLISLFISFLLLIAITVGAPITIGVVMIAGAFSSVLLIVVMLLVVVMVIVALWVSIKTVWSLLKALVNVLLLTILAPIQLTLGNFIPSMDFSAWIKSYISNLSVFVVTGTLLLFSYIFLAEGVLVGFTSIGAGDFGNILSKLILGGGNTGNPFSGNTNAWPPLLGLGNGAGVGLLLLAVSFVLFTLIPKAAEIIQGLLSGKPFAYGTAIGEAMGPEVLRKMVSGTTQGVATNYGVNRAVESLGRYNESLDQNSRYGRFMSGLEDALKGLQKQH